MSPASSALRAVPPPIEPGPPPPHLEAGDGVSEWVKFGHALWHSRWLILACVVVSLMLATAYNYTARPRYQAVAQIEIRKTKANLAPGSDVLEAITPEWVETQLRMLTGKSMISKVVERYDFGSAPELRTGPLRSPMELIRTRLLGRSEDNSVSEMPVAPAVAAFRSRVSIQSIPRTSLVEIAFVAYDPKFAAMAANGLAQTYVDESRSSRTDQSAEATQWLKDRLRVEQKEAQSSFEALRAFEERSGTSNLEARGRLAEAKLQQASSRLLQARSDAASKKSYRDQLRALSPADLMTLPELAGNASYQALRKELLETQLRKSDLDQSLGPKHPDVVALASRIETLKKTLSTEAQGVVRAAETAYEAAAREEAVVAASVDAAQAEMAALRDKSPEYMTLKREADAANALAQSLAVRGREANVEGAENDRTVRMVEPADVPLSPIFPDRMGNLRLALVVGLGMGVLLVAARERLDTTVKDPDDVREALRVPFLGFVPDLATVGSPLSGRNLTVVKEATTPLAESYRVIRTNLTAAASAIDARVLLVTSIHPGEGKSSTSLNLAAAMAQTGASVVLVDADLRRPTVHANLELLRSPGLRDVLSAGRPAAALVQTTATKGLVALCAGTTPDNPAELIGSDGMRQMLGELRAEYDWVIVDAPPVGGMADALVLGGLVDGVLLVIEGDRTTKAVAADGVGQLRSVGGRVLGAVLNRVNVKRSSYYLSRYATGYYGGYGFYGTVYSRYAPGGSDQPGPRRKI